MDAVHFAIAFLPSYLVADEAAVKYTGSLSMPAPYSTSEQFREGTELMLNELLHNGASHVLADLREMVLIGLEDQKWLGHKFLPRAIRKSDHHLA
jgi:hypothetical protein